MQVKKAEQIGPSWATVAFSRASERVSEDWRRVENSAHPCLTDVTAEVLQPPLELKAARI
jgi:hypothetical protein